VKQLDSLVHKVLEENAHLRTDAGVKLQVREFDLWLLVESLNCDLMPLANSSKTEVINRIPHELSCLADADLLRRIFQNLIANAIRHSPEGRVIIEARMIIESDDLECSVHDNGAGMPPDQLSKLLAWDEDGPGQEGNTGLGLSIVKRFVEAHGGKLTAESKVGFGSLFRFTLPKKPGSKNQSPD
jgi:signal transduction histidine kinase